MQKEDQLSSTGDVVSAKRKHVNVFIGETDMSYESYEDESPVQEQGQPQPTMDQLIYALMWEMQALRGSVMALKESVDGLTSVVRED